MKTKLCNICTYKDLVVTCNLCKNNSNFSSSCNHCTHEFEDFHNHKSTCYQCIHRVKDGFKAKESSK